MLTETEQNCEVDEPAGGIDFKRAVRAAIKAYDKTGSMLEAALAYACNGVPVFPLDPRTKKPIAARLDDVPGTGGFYRATTDPEQIREWWSVKNWPGVCFNYLIGVPMGARIGVWVLDVDTTVEHDEDGIAAWKALQKQHGAVRVKREHRTSSNGLHLCFEWTAAHPIGLSTGSLPGGMEVKAQGGYVAVPPSRRKGKPYVVSIDGKPGVAPAWLYDLIRLPPGKSRAARSSSSKPSSAAWDDHNAIVDPDLLADALRFIPNVFGWVEWNNFILAIFRATGGSKRGFQIADAWSKTNKKKYKKAYMPGRWEVIRGSPPTRTGASKIWNEAIRNGWKAKATYAPPKFDGLAAARDRLRQLIRRFLGIGLNPYQAFGHACRGLVEAIKVTTGVGKTTIAAEVVAELFTLSTQTGKRIGLSVPTHKLGKEIEQLFINLGADVRVFRGRDADDPETPGEKMCLDLPKVEVAKLAMQNITKSCCKFKNDECPFYSAKAPRQCGYWRQQNGKKPSVWIFPHDLHFHDQPALGEPDFLFIDESFWDKQLRGIDSPWELPIESLLQNPNAGVTHVTIARNILGELLNLQTDDGGLQRVVIEGITDAHEQTEEIIQEWKHMPKLGLRPSMGRKQYSALNKKLIGDITFARKIIAVREELRNMLLDPNIKVSGRLVLEHSSKLQQRVITWRGVAPIAKRFQVPTLMLDATLPALEVLQVSHPAVKITADIEVAMPDSVRIRQVLKSPTSATKLSNEKLLEEVRRYVLQRWFETGRQKTLVIAQQKVAAWLKDKLLPEIAVEHYKAISGLDKHKDVRLLILIGRTQPGPEAVEALAATLSGQMPPSVINGNGFSWYKRVHRGIRVKGGAGRAVMTDQHPDPLCEAIRWQINEGELMQALGRARGVNRDKDSPLDIDLLFDVVLPIEVDAVMTWERPSLYITTAAEGVMLESPIDMVKLWPTLWPYKAAADRTVAGGVPALPGFVRVSYQLEALKRKRRTGHFDPAVIPDPKAWLESRLGPLRSLA